MLIGAWTAPAAFASGYLWETVAGNTHGAGINDGELSDSRFDSPVGLAVDAEGNVFVTDTRGHTVRKITPSGVVSTLAGNPAQPGSDDGIGQAATFNQPYGIAAMADGSLVVSDASNHTIRSISPDGVVSTLAGMAGVSGAVNGTAGDARFNNPQGIAVMQDGSILVVEITNHAIRRITPSGMVETYAGALGQAGTQDGTRAEARFRWPSGLAISPDGSVFVCEAMNQRIRKIAPDGMVSTYSGAIGSSGFTDGALADARFTTPMGLSVAPDGSLLVSEIGNHTIRRISLNGLVSTVSGAHRQQGMADGDPATARYARPRGVLAMPDGTILVADTGNHAIRRIGTDAHVSMLNAGGPPQSGWSDGVGTAVRLYEPNTMTRMPNGVWMIADGRNRILRTMTDDGEVTTYAGKVGVDAVLDGTLEEATIGYATSLTFDPAGNFVIADSYGPSLRRVTPAGEIETFFTGSRGQVDPAQIRFFTGMTGVPSGDYYFGDQYMIRRISPDGVNHHVAGPVRSYTVMPSGGVLTYWAQHTPAVGTNGDGIGINALIRRVTGLTSTATGAVYFVDREMHNLRRVDPKGMVTTLAGLALQAGHVDGTGINARFNAPEAVTAAPDGQFYVLDNGNGVVRRVSPEGVVTTLAGISGYQGIGDGDQLVLRDPSSIQVDTDGRIWIVDRGNHRIVRGTPLRLPRLVVDAEGVSRVSREMAWPYGMVKPGEHRTRIVTLRNLGNQPLDISSLTMHAVSGFGFSIEGGATLPASILPGEATDVPIRFTPVAIGHVDAELVIASNDPEDPEHVLVLRGTGNVPPVFAGYSFSTPSNGGGTRIPFTKILRHASHPFGHEISVLSVVPMTPSQHYIRVEDDHIVFTPNRFSSGNNHFFINLVDELGYVIQARIDFTIYGVSATHALSATNTPKITLLPENRLRLEYNGIPGRNYVIQGSVTSTYWETLTTVTADASGRIEWIDAIIPGSSRLYRIGQP